MFCSRCGAPIEQNSSFCSKCGAPTNAAPQAPVQPQQPVYQQPVYQQPVYQQPVYQQPVYQAPVYQAPVQPAGPTLAEDPTRMAMARDAVRKICGSPLFLIAVICYTLFQLYYLFNGSFGYWLGYKTQEFFRFFDAYRVSGDIAEFHYELGFATTVGVLLNLVIVAGLWVTFISARTKKNVTAGLTMIKVISIIEMIAVILYIFISSIPAVIEILDGSYYRAESVMALLSYVAVGECLTVLVIFFFIKMMTTLGMVKEAINNGTPNRKASGFVAIVCFAIGAIIAWDVFTSLYNLFDYLEVIPVRSWLGYFLSLAAAAVHFLIGVLIFQYNGLMSKAEQGTYELEQPADAAVTE